MISLFFSCPRGVEPLLAAELRQLSIGELRERPGGVAGRGEWADAYRACLWSRLANRVLWSLSSGTITDANDLYTLAKSIDWPALFDLRRSFLVEVAGQTPLIANTQFAAVRVKDAVADRFREALGERPNVDREDADLRVHLHLSRQTASLSLDLAGASLHQRSGHRSGTPAPLKENLAAALLARAGWPQAGTLLDPMCGSGTLVLEAAAMRADLAPGLPRERFGFMALSSFDAAVWEGLRSEAQARASAGLAQALPPLIGRDLDERGLSMARAAARRLGLQAQVHFEPADLSTLTAPSEEPGLVIVNPPYGERLGEEAEVIKVLSLLGERLRRYFPGWRAAVFTARPDLAPRMGLRANAMHAFYNGAIPCKLLQFEIPAVVAREASGVHAEDFENRLKKNARHLNRWARRNDVGAFRVYDADLPDFALAIDVYECNPRHVVLQEYAAPDTIDPVRAEQRLRAALNIVTTQLEVPASHLHLRRRERQRGSDQYEPLDQKRDREIVQEHGCRFYVNFTDYLDTGLFLDHRPLRLRLQREAKGKRFLNLFCYTASATVHAARGGATRTLSLDLSNRYLEWAEANLALNQLAGPAHQFLRADCLRWLEQPARGADREFDLILCDPPTFSNSKKMSDTLDLQRDHGDLLRALLKRLAPGGQLYFSTNRRRFTFDKTLSQDCEVTDITDKTLDEDFQRARRPHRCWLLTHQKPPGAGPTEGR